MNLSALHQRLVLAIGDRSYRSVGELTGIHPENIRRYMKGQTPSVEFVASLCDALGISPEWMLSGRGPMRAEDVKGHALRQANPAELLTAMAEMLERLGERVGRLEAYVQTLEARPRVAAGSGRNAGTGEDSGERRAVDRAGVVGRAGKVADAVAKRPRQAAG